MRSDMGDLDTSLIQEFALRPAFYNKSSPHYKDKVYIEHAWLEISTKLGYEAVLLKDRIYQLRNRYNLEKRKVESMRCEGILDAKSSWPLFGYLTFLDGHIRPRKSYKSMMRRSFKDEEDDFLQQAHSMHMPSAEIKYERSDQNDVSNLYQCGDYDQSEDDNRNQTQNGGDHFINPANFLVDDTESEHDQMGIDAIKPQQSQPPTNNHHQNNTVALDARTPDARADVRPDIRPTGTPGHNNNSNNSNSSLILRNINTMKRTYAAENAASNNSYQNKFKLPRIEGAYSTGVRSMQPSMMPRPIQPQQHQPAPVHQSSDKFSAFGSFMTASLLDLPEERALELVEKFTNEIVRALLDKGGSNKSSASSANSSMAKDDNHIL